jgi:hypothetical protein
MSQGKPRDPILALAGKVGGHARHAQVEDPSSATAPARAGFDQRFLDEADGDPVRAAHLRKAYFARLALAGVMARRRAAREAVDVAAAEDAEAELRRLDEAGGGPDG